MVVVELLVDGGRTGYDKCSAASPNDRVSSTTTLSVRSNSASNANRDTNDVFDSGTFPGLDSCNPPPLPDSLHYRVRSLPSLSMLGFKVRTNT